MAVITRSCSEYLKLISNHNCCCQVKCEKNSCSSPLWWLCQSGLVLLWQLGMSFTSLGMSDGHLKSWDLFFFLKKDNRSGLCSRSLSLLLGEGLRPAAEGQTSNQELGGPGDARDPMGALQGWSAKREAFAIQSQLWQKTGGDLGSPLASERGSQGPVGVPARG